MPQHSGESDGALQIWDSSIIIVTVKTERTMAIGMAFGDDEDSSDERETRQSKSTCAYASCFVAYAPWRGRHSHL